MKVTLRATFDAATVDLNGESYLLIKRSDFARLFDGAEVTAMPTITIPPARQARTPRQPRPQLQLNNGQPAPAGAVPGETPVSQTFADCVRIALRNVGPASIGDILQDLTDSEIQADRQKVTACLAGLRQRGDVIRQDDGKWRAA